MRIRNFNSSEELINNSQIIVHDYPSLKGHWQEFFDNDNQVHLEIGMGKGQFLLGNALANPNINYIGVEKYSTIVARALQKIESYELNNLKIVIMDATKLEEAFAHEIDCIYLNHSDPWPKARHVKRRLTSPDFLKIYDKLFKDKKTIIQKTDNDELFAYSLETLQDYGYEIVKRTTDLENSDIPNIKTEYEEKFMSIGKNINYLKAVK